MKTLLLPLFGLALATQAMAHPPKSEQAPMRHMLEQLTLSEQQREDIRLIVSESRADKRVYVSDIRLAKKEFRQLVREPEWNETAVREVMTQRMALKQDFMLSNAQTRHAIFELLTPSQQQELNTLSSPDKTHRASQRGSQWKKMSQRLNLTPEQEDNIDTIRAAFFSTHERGQHPHRVFLQAERSLIQSSEFSQDAWLALFAQHQTAAVEYAVARAKMQHDMFNVLTKEQQNQLTDIEDTMSEKGRKGRRRGQHRA
ncbi:Spy/CpxP family protein refolding chaperone [Alteromonas oceanisediminis]|uniref:Spy/CpxP family protein refolding chaperone n=1 Tax=Alteromonas oceanisediminis TaxID=2836180 RepID=UPI001BD9305F|nr:Spy/CpxP family protein refolding chaperone [Alteromonas oceanisediminis]MBT0586076.1 Spy/CpxP family protein refolding chaperone [Alteromonas oceanisediminis]